MNPQASAYGMSRRAHDIADFCERIIERAAKQSTRDAAGAKNSPATDK